MVEPDRNEELSVEELEQVAGGVGDNVNCVSSCVSNFGCPTSSDSEIRPNDGTA